MKGPGAIPAFFLFGTVWVAGRCRCMSKPPIPPEDIITEPLNPEPTDGVVVVKDPPEAAMNLTADAAEISGIRMLDAADRARKQR